MTTYEELSSAMNCGYTPEGQFTIRQKLITALEPNLEYYKKLSNRIMREKTPTDAENLLYSLGFTKIGTKNDFIEGYTRNYYFSKQKNLTIGLLPNYSKRVNYVFAFFKNNDFNQNKIIQISNTHEDSPVFKKTRNGLLFNNQGVSQIKINFERNIVWPTYSINSAPVTNYEEWIKSDQIQKVLRELKSNEGNSINF